MKHYQGRASRAGLWRPLRRRISFAIAGWSWLGLERVMGIEPKRSKYAFPREQVRYGLRARLRVISV